MIVEQYLPTLARYYLQPLLPSSSVSASDCGSSNRSKLSLYISIFFLTIKCIVFLLFFIIAQKQLYSITRYKSQSKSINYFLIYFFATCSILDILEGLTKRLCTVLQIPSLRVSKFIQIDYSLYLSRLSCTSLSRSAYTSLLHSSYTSLSCSSCTSLSYSSYTSLSRSTCASLSRSACILYRVSVILSQLTVIILVNSYYPSKEYKVY